MDDFSYRLHCAVDTADAVYAAMAEGPSCMEDYTDALIGAIRYLGILSDELVEMVNNSYSRQGSKEVKA